MRKRIFSVAMALCMVLGLLPATAWAADTVTSVNIGSATLSRSNPYYHNGENGIQGTANNVSTGANASFDVNTGTLTLNGLYIVNEDNNYRGIQWSFGDLTIKLQGGSTNIVENTSGAAIVGDNGMISNGSSLTIEGSGSLKAIGTTSGIWVWHNITIKDSATVNAIGGKKMGIGIAYSGTISIADSAKVSAKSNSIDNSIGNSIGMGREYNYVEEPVSIIVGDGAALEVTGASAAFGAVAGGNQGIHVTLNANGTQVVVGESATSNTPWDSNANTLTTNKYVKVGTATIPVIGDVPGGGTPTLPVTQTHNICGEADCSEHGAALTWKAVTTEAELQSAATNGGRYYLADNITLSEDLTTSSSEDFNLCLNGHVLNLNGHVIKVMSRGDGTKKTNLCDCQNTAHKFKVEDGKWVLDEEHGTEAVQGGVITGGNNQGVNVNGGFDMYGGNIVGNTATNGGGVYVTDGTFNMYGGNIKGNKATNGGGVYVNSVFNIYGGSITDNTATGNGGGVYDYGMLDVSGDVNISGNKKGDDANNVYLPSGKTIKIDGALDSSVIIGVTTEAIPAGNSSVGITNTYNALDYNRNFVSDNTTYKTFRDTYNKIRLGVEGDAPTAYEVRVTPNSAECGSVDISGTVDSSGNYSAGTPVRVTAIPKVDARKAHRFVGWYWDNSTTLVSTNNPYTFNVTGTAKLRTEFEEIPVGTLQISASPDSMRGAGTVTLTVVNNTGDPSVNVTCNNDITVTGAGNTRSAYLPNQTQTYTFTAEAGGQSATCTVDVRKKSSSSSDSSSGGSSNEKPEEKPVEKPEEKPEEVPKDNEIVLTIGEKVTVVFGDPVVNDVAPILRNDRAMLPIRFVVEALGGTVTWNEAQQSVTCVKGDNTITIYIGHPFALVNGNPVELDSPAFIENDRTYLPIRFIAENLDAAVTWNADAQEVTFVPNK